jgi:serine/threonine-protein kinase
MAGGPAQAGRYELLFPLGAGGMGSVYAARLSGLAGFEKLAAVKVIHPHLMLNASFVDMFLDEARLAARIDHPNVVHIQEVGEDGGLLYMVMELVRGQHLLSVAERSALRSEPVGPILCASIGARVALGLHAAHELRSARGEPLDLVHRDVCPQNILVSYDGEVKLIDFGVAFARERLAQTQVGKVKGKLRYMAPERLMGHDTDRRSDIYSLGVVLFEVARFSFCQPEPGPASSDPELLALERGERVGNLPSAFLSVIAQATNRNPGKRFSTAALFAEALESAVNTMGGGVSQAELSALMRRLFVSEEQTLTTRLSSSAMSELELAARDDGPGLTRPEIPSAMPKVRPRSPRRRFRSWVWTAIGTALLGAAIGVTTAILSVDKNASDFLERVEQTSLKASSDSLETERPQETSSESGSIPIDSIDTTSTPSTSSTTNTTDRNDSNDTNEKDSVIQTPEPVAEKKRQKENKPVRVQLPRKSDRVDKAGKKTSSDKVLFDSPYDK